MLGLSLGLTLGNPALQPHADTEPAPVPLSAIDALGVFGTYTDTMPTEFDPAASPITFAVSSPGFDNTGSATTKTRTLTVTKRERLLSSTDLTTDGAALSEVVYGDDTVGSATNNSTFTSPKPIARWVSLDRDFIEDTLAADKLEVVAFHRDYEAGKPVACVEWIISDGTDSITVRSDAPVVSGRASDKFPVIVYRPAADVDISSLADPADITVECNVYPHVGVAASVRRTTDATAGAFWEFSQRKFRRDTSPTTYYAYADGSLGDVIGTASTDPATAAADPSGTIAKALESLQIAIDTNGVVGIDGSVVRLVGTDDVNFSRMPGSRNTAIGDYAVRIERESGATARIQIADPSNEAWIGINQFGDCATIRFHEIDLVRGSDNDWQRVGAGNGTDSHVLLQFDACTMDAGANGFGIPSNEQITLAVNGLDVTDDGAEPSLSGRPVSDEYPRYALLRGAEATVAAFPLEMVVGCHLKGPSATGGIEDNGEDVWRNNSMVAFSHLDDAVADGQVNSTLAIAQNEDVSGFAVVQNLITARFKMSAIMRISSDNTTSDSEHVLIWHNTFPDTYAADNRFNIFYDDGSTVSTNHLASMVGTICGSLNTKGDLFTTDRTGTLHFCYGANCQGNFTQWRDAGNVDPINLGFAQTYPGLRSDISTSVTVRNDPLFVDYQGPTASADGAGGGDYRLQSSSPAQGLVVGTPLPFDLDGDARSTTAAAAGCYA